MKRLVLAVFLVVYLPACWPATADDKPLVIDVWPGKTADDDASTIGEEKFIELKVNGKPYEVAGKPTKWLTNVTKPTLTIYRPARDKDTGTAMLICPGGGYHNLGWDVEGEEIAEWLNSLGVTGIILKYRCPRRPGDVKGVPPLGPLKDAQRAVSLVRSKAAEWGIDPKRIGMIGFSAGGHLVGATATNFEKRSYEPIDAIDRISCRPDFAIPVYSGYFKVDDGLSPTIRLPADSPPLLFVHASDDAISDVEHSVTMYLALKRAGIHSDLHVYASGGHGFGVRPSTGTCSAWMQNCVAWLRSREFLPSKSASCNFEVSEPAPIAAASSSSIEARFAGQETDVTHEDDPLRPFLARHCLECHGIEKPKGDFRLDRLSKDFADDASRDRWLTVLKRVKAGEMPPKTKPRPSQKEVQTLADWVNGKLQTSEAARRAAHGRVVLRRLNRVEYENTVRDLLGIEIELKDLLPPDSSANGFDNVGDALHTSSFLMERCLEAADKALNLAIANLPQPPLVKKRYSLKNQHQVKSTTERVFRQLDDTVVMFSSSPWQGITMAQFYPPDRGNYRVRISASGIQSASKPVTYRVDAGPMLMGTKSHLIGYFDAPADQPAVVEFVDHFEARSTIRILPHGLASAQEVDKIGADQYEGPGLAVEWVDVEGPLHEMWPPESHRRIFGDLPQEFVLPRDWRNRVEVTSKDPLPDAQKILRNFARRAFRRAVTDEDVKPFVELVEKKLAESYSFEQAVRVGLMGVMVSPEFLFLRERPGKLDDFALASRLSYFLWSTMPDAELLTLAEKQKLGQPELLRQQVERLLASPKAAAFTENFVGQWLGLRDIDFTEPDRRLYPEFDDMLKAAIVQETHLFFNELLTHDLSLTNFVASDFAMLNERLAKHYGIPSVEGHAFRKVSLPPNSHRGGVMTMASVLKVTANGTNTSPVVRGAWVLDRILGTPPSPPPGGVPAIEPDIRGATTIREQLAKHRQIESCASCHTQIDPPGFALESFDVIGGWRDYYRSVGNGKPVSIDGRRMHYAQGPNVDPADALPDGRPFANIDEFKQLLLADKDQLARALTTKLLTYATGHAPEAADQPAVEAIIARVREKNYGLRSLVHEIVQSQLFQDK